MLTPFAGASALRDQDEQAPVPEIVPIDELSAPEIEAAAAEIAERPEEDEWPASV